MGILLTEADAAAAAGGTAGFLSILLIYGLMIAALWFFFMRPQNKEKKRLAAMLSALEVGDCVCTTSGFYGIVIDIQDSMVIVEFGNNKNCRIPMEKSAISRVEKPETN
ncbi:MAG: preprotein translocase subunit YajC [Eubacterium sp.]|nr:preprotein translocase subunit YajC [Eubacterium sp.]MCM1217567.1 preprotein translocase subunit YajC [Lachnospiraceae bacterium]MCM1302967.1 preprotein translocase subunit YajC [Butyrivibrio sp.]MCM1344889.1 preprotein translocase subunit YajC [Muribaculaceae bacterium]MCM1239770.1 preprotein translocase subunit YajC [Lachnospiraceae bacterium]